MDIIFKKRMEVTFYNNIQIKPQFNFLKVVKKFKSSHQGTPERRC